MDILICKLWNSEKLWQRILEKRSNASKNLEEILFIDHDYMLNECYLLAIRYFMAFYIGFSPEIKNTEKSKIDMR